MRIHPVLFDFVVSLAVVGAGTFFVAVLIAG